MRRSVLKRVFFSVLASAALVSASAATAHTAWLVQDAQPGVWLLMFGGHEGKTQPAVPAKLKTVTAVDALGSPLEVSRLVEGNEVRVVVAGEPAMLALHYDNGIHTRMARQGPSIERPMNEVPGAASATAALKYGKTIVHWAPVVTQPINQPLEVIPMTATQPRAGEPMLVQVWLNGQPAAGVKLGRSEEGADAVTDESGMANFVPTAGFNKVWAGKRIATSNNPSYTELSYEYSLGFEAQP